MLSGYSYRYIRLIVFQSPTKETKCKHSDVNRAQACKVMRINQLFHMDDSCNGVAKETSLSRWLNIYWVFFVGFNVYFPLSSCM